MTGWRLGASAHGCSIVDLNTSLLLLVLVQSPCPEKNQCSFCIYKYHRLVCSWHWGCARGFAPGMALHSGAQLFSCCSKRGGHSERIGIWRSSIGALKEVGAFRARLEHSSAVLSRAYGHYVAVSCAKALLQYEVRPTKVRWLQIINTTWRSERYQRGDRRDLTNTLASAQVYASQ